MAFILRCMPLFGLIGYFALVVLAVDQNNFKKCEQSSFCRRCRNIKPGQSPYYLNLDSLQVSESDVDAELVNKENNARFKFTLTSLVDSTFRLFVDEVEPLHPRYKVHESFEKKPQHDKLTVVERNKELITVSNDDNRVTMHSFPFKVEFYKNDKLVSVVNARGLMNFEHFREKKLDPPPEDINPNDSENRVEENKAPAVQDDPGTWEENFKSHHDAKPRGPEAVALDITFPGAEMAYGLPEHADHLALRSTGLSGTDPYRLYNLDVFEYELDSTMAIYGSVPVLYAHGPERTTGVFWNNAAETWVDIKNSKDSNVVSSLVSFVSGSKTETQVESHFMSESGVIDLFVMLGPKPKNVVKQYAALTGTAPLPQYFTLGYHQCRWNYNDEEDVRTVVENFDIHNMPLDVMWLDIEYTDNKKYFTWDSIKFPHPQIMQQNLTSLGRKLVVIIDPHIKRDSGYFLHNEALANDYYVKNKDGSVYEGWCWPGSSSYLDFFNPTVQSYYSGLYDLSKFPGATQDMYIWNDMNEPSVFNGPEITMPKDCVHYGGWEHRHVHNLYGIYHTSATFSGLLARSHNMRRPFILTRAHFAGSQRTAAVWTGDNAAEWSHLAISYPMCLSLAVSGISFCGADVGGFFKNPDVELLTRWYQAGAWLPFYRAHAHIDTKRREPYLFPEDVRTRIRKALQQRYAYLPLWYTLFWEHQRTGEPVIRPLFYEYPEDVKVVDVDNELLVGSSLLVHPVTEAGVSTVTIYLPGGSNEYWYDTETYKLYTGTGNLHLPVTLDKTPVFQRGGTIVPRKDRPRRSSALTHNDPYTLVIALGADGFAKGTLYIDDTQSYDYRNKKYLYMQFEFKKNKLISKFIDSDAFYPTQAWLERVIILGAPKGVKSATASSKSVGTLPLQTTYDGEMTSLVIRKPAVSMSETWNIVLNF